MSFEWCFTSDSVESSLNSCTGCCVLTLLSSHIVYVCTSITQLGFHLDSFLLHFHVCSESVGLYQSAEYVAPLLFVLINDTTSVSL